MELDEVTISRAILATQMETMVEYLDLDVAVPAGRLYEIRLVATSG